MCGASGGNGGLQAAANAGYAKLYGAMPAPAAPATAAAAVVNAPRVSTVGTDAIQRRNATPRAMLGAAPSTPQQTLRATLGGI